MSSSDISRFGEPDNPAEGVRQQGPRNAGSPLPRGPEGRIEPPASGDPRRTPGGGGPRRPSSGGMDGFASVLQRVVTVARAALPLLPHLLPDPRARAAASAVTGALGPRPQPVSAPPVVKQSQVEESLIELRSQQSALQNQMAEQNTSLKRVEDRLDKVREATDRNTLEQQELLDELKKFSKKALIFAIAVSVLLAASIVCNVILFLRHP